MDLIYQSKKLIKVKIEELEELESKKDDLMLSDSDVCFLF